jgi:hypothetical protein
MRHELYQCWRSGRLCRMMSGCSVRRVFGPSNKTKHDPPVPLAWLMIEEKARFGAGHQLFEFLHAERWARTGLQWPHL